MIGFVGAYAYALEVLEAMVAAGYDPTAVVTAPPGAPRWQDISGISSGVMLRQPIELIEYSPKLVVVAGWRRLIPRRLLETATVVGFHSAKLPEYPGRAPVPWTLLRGDRLGWNTLLYLDDDVDAGDIVEAEPIPIGDGETPDTLYTKLGRSSAELIVRHLPALLEGTAPRHPQDIRRRGPLTTSDGWARWYEFERMGQGHA